MLRGGPNSQSMEGAPGKSSSLAVQGTFCPVRNFCAEKAQKHTRVSHMNAMRQAHDHFLPPLCPRPPPYMPPPPPPLPLVPCPLAGASPTVDTKIPVPGCLALGLGDGRGAHGGDRPTREGRSLLWHQPDLLNISALVQRKELLMKKLEVCLGQGYRPLSCWFPDLLLVMGNGFGTVQGLRRIMWPEGFQWGGTPCRHRLRIVHAAKLPPGLVRHYTVAGQHA